MHVAGGAGYLCPGALRDEFERRGARVELHAEVPTHVVQPFLCERGDRGRLVGAVERAIWARMNNRDRGDGVPFA